MDGNGFLKNKLLAFVAAITAEEKKKKFSRPSWVGGTSSQTNPIPTPPSPTYHLDFDGIDDKIIVSHAASINNLPLNDFTVDFAGSINPNISGYIISKSSAGFLGWEIYQYGLGTSTPEFYFAVSGDGGGGYTIPYFPLQSLSAHHFEFVWFSGTASAKMFVDGIEVSSIAEDKVPFVIYDDDAINNIGIGSHPSVSQPLINLDFDLNWMTISNVARHSSSFVPPSLTTCPSNDANTVLRLALEEGAGIIANDTSGNNNNGTITGATWQAD